MSCDDPGSFFQEVVETMGVGIAVYTDNGTFDYVNQSYADLFETDRSALEGVGIWEVNPEFERDRFDDYWQSFTIGETRVAETRHEFGDTTIPVSVTTTCREIHEDVYHFGTIQDISDLRERERKLNHLREILTRVLRHNIRNSLSVILGHGSRIAAADDEEYAAMGRAIVEQANDLLRISETAQGIGTLLHRETPVVSYDLPAVVEETLDTIHERHAEISIVTEMPDTCHVRATEGLPTALERLLVHAVDKVDTEHCRFTIVIRESDAVSLRVETTERCISTEAITALSRAEESPLEHGDGVALWLVDWVVTRTGEVVELRSEREGTHLEIEFPPAPAGGTSRRE